MTVNFSDILIVGGGIVSMLVVFFNLDAKVQVLDTKVKANATAILEQHKRMDKHESDFKDELKSINEKIDTHHKQVIDTLTDIKIDLEKIRK